MAKGIMWLSSVFQAIANSGKFRHRSIDSDNVFEFLTEFRNYPDVIEAIRPKDLSIELFARILEKEANAIRSSSSEESIEDIYGIREKLKDLFPTNEEIKALVASKEEHHRSEPDYPDGQALTRYRIAKAGDEIDLMRKSVVEVSIDELVQNLDTDGIRRFYFKGVRFTGIAVERKSAGGFAMVMRIWFVASQQRKPVHRSIEFKDGLKHGEEVIYKHSVTEFNQNDLGNATYSSWQEKPWRYNVRTYKMGVLISDKFYSKDGREKASGGNG